MWTAVILIISVVALVMALVNRTARIRNGEDIDEIRNSLYELRITLKSLRAEWNFKLAKIQVNLLKYQEKIPRDRIPYFITGECIACGSCLPECPTNAITENLLFEIDPALCIACRKCAEICPVGACRPLEEPAGAFSA